MTTDDYSGLERFAEVDATGEEALFISFLERVEQLPDVIARRRRSYELLAFGRGDRVADVGCGLGTAARELAAIGARAIGFDASKAMVAEARRRSEGLSIEFAFADAVDLPLEDGALRGYRAERVYQHLADPPAALAEARRVLAADAHVVLVDQDWDALLIDGEPKDVTRAILQAHSDSFRKGAIGRSYHRLLTEAGFADVTVHPETVPITSGELVTILPKLAAGVAVEAGAVDADTAGRWLADLHTRQEAGTFFAAMTHFVAVARRSK
jgi:ubiquinone/menaquinone biosynthesis C-methylase UbiE